VVDGLNINRACESTGENIKASATDSLDYYELKQHTPWFDDECSNYYIRGSGLN
jgi:hypothetical protein